MADAESGKSTAPERPTSGLESTVAPAYQQPISGDAPTVAPSLPPTVGPPGTANDLPELPIVEAGLYAIGPEIGRGGMGRVIAARDRRLRRDVVIKVLHRDAAASRFQREALITARLQHPSIVRVYDAGWLDGAQPFYAMERVRGTSLDRVVAAADDARARLALLPHVIAVAEAIAYAHSEGVIHRDLKPHNVLVGGFGETVVIDWGLAKDLRATDTESLDPRMPVASADDKTMAGAVMGTPAFMPPEQARGEPADQRSDVYAIGAILYSVLCGSPPVSGERALEDASVGSITPLREREPSVPPELASIVERAMAFAPADRYATAKELADELRRYQTGQLVSSHTYSTATLIGRWMRRHRAALGVAAAAIVVLAAASVIYVRKIFEERDLARQAAARELAARVRADRRSDDLMIDQAESLTTSDPSMALALLSLLTPESLALARTHTIANTAAANGVGFELAGPHGDIEHVVIGKTGRFYTGSDDGHLWGWSIESHRGDDLGAHTGPIETMAIASNGVLLATGGTDGTVHLWDLVTGESKILTGHGAAIRTVAFAPDNTTFVSASEDHTLRQWSVAAGDGKVIVKDTYPLRGIAWHPDGTRLWVGTNDGHIIEVELATAKLTRIAAHTDELRVLALSPDGTKLASGGEDGAVVVTTLADHSSRKLATHDDVVRDVLWTRDGSAVISAGGDPKVLVTSLDGHSLVLAGNTAGVKEIALSPDGRLVAAAGIDEVARVWPVTGGPPRELRGHRGSVKDVEFTPDSAMLVSTSEDDRARLWPLATPSPAPTGPALVAWIHALTNVSPTRR